MNGQTPSHPSANLIQWHQENPDIQAIITSINNHHLSILEGRYDTLICPRFNGQFKRLISCWPIRSLQAIDNRLLNACVYGCNTLQ